MSEREQKLWLLCSGVMHLGKEKTQKGAIECAGSRSGKGFHFVAHTCPFFS